MRRAVRVAIVAAVLCAVGCDRGARRLEEAKAYRCGKNGGEWQSGVGGFSGRCAYWIGNDQCLTGEL